MVTLLLVDDEDLVKKGIKTFVDFEKLGIGRLLEASNGLEALALFEADSIQLVLMDINIPKLNGLEVAKRMKAQSPQVKIAMLTGYDYFDYAVSALKIGAMDYILKPVSKQDVTEVLARMVQAYAADLEQEALAKVVDNLAKNRSGEADKGYKALIQEQVDRHIDDPQFSLSALAKALGFSTGYLSGLFKEHFGIPFQDYMLMMRLEKAKLLLLSTDMKNYQIAEAVGFEDVNYFGTRFKKQFGMSPKQYQQKVRSEDEMV